MLCNLLKSCCHFQLSLNLSSQLHHLPPALSILSPDQLYDGGGQRHPDEDVDGAEQHCVVVVLRGIKAAIHVAGAVVRKVGGQVSEANGGHGDEAEIERVQECPVFK